MLITEEGQAHEETGKHALVAEPSGHRDCLLEQGARGRKLSLGASDEAEVQEREPNEPEVAERSQQPEGFFTEPAGLVVVACRMRDAAQVAER
jgi:hypothetical protein